MQSVRAKLSIKLVIIFGWYMDLLLYIHIETDGNALLNSSIQYVASCLIDCQNDKLNFSQERGSARYGWN